MELWSSLCKNKLLSTCHLVLFLNKCDILEKKLNSGIQFQKYVKTYGDQRGNEYESVRQCEWNLSLRLYWCGFAACVPFHRFYSEANCGSYHIIDLKRKFEAMLKHYSPVN